MIKKYLITLCLFLASAFGLDVPINHSIGLNAKLGEYTIIEFPFAIKGVNSASFIPKFKETKDGDSVLLSMVEGDTKKETVIDEKTGKERDVIKKVNKNKRYVSIKRGHNTLTLYPKKYGTLKLIVWGGEYPIVLNIESQTDAVSTYYKMVSPEIKKGVAKKFESVSHEKVITKMIKYMFNNKTPGGFEYRAGNKEFELNHIHFVQNFLYVGPSYTGETYIVENMTADDVTLYEEMFYSSTVYAVALEDNVLNPKEKTRLFLVRKTQAE